MMVAPGYLAAIAAKGPVSLTAPSMITTAPAGITPDDPRRGSVIAYPLRMMIVSLMTLHPSQFDKPQTPAGTNLVHALRITTWPQLAGAFACPGCARHHCRTFARRNNERNDPQ